MATIMTTGQITLVDLTDQRTSSFYLQANKSKIQVYDVNTKTYTPNYSENALTITPSFFFGTDDYTNKLSTNISYTINERAVSGLSTSLAYQQGNQLIITANINSSESAPFNTDTLKIVATIAGNTVTDDQTDITVEKALTAEIEIAKVNTGLQGSDGKGISEIKQLYKLTNSTTTIPDKPESPSTLNGWSYTNPTWDSENIQYLWICTETTYSNNTYSYTTPYTDENWKTAADAVVSMEGSFGELKELVDTLQDEVDNAIETWYIEGEPSTSNPPWGSEDSSTHVGDLYYDISTGYSYRFFKKEDNSYEWTRISDSDVTKALEDVAKLQDVVDGKVTIYYDATEPQPSETLVLNIGDLWMPADGNFYKWDGTKWVLANEIIDRIEVQYAENQSNTSTEGIEESDWSTTTPEWKEGWYIWQRTVTYYREDTVGTPSEPSCISVAGAAAIFAIVESTTGQIVFTDTNAENIQLKASLYIGGTIRTDEDVTYSWTSIPSGITGSDSTLTISRNQVPSARSFMCTITYDGKTYTDVIAISDKTDPVWVEITSSNGDKFTNGNTATTLTAILYGSVKGKYTNEEMNSYYFNWKQYDKDGNIVDSFSPDYVLTAVGKENYRNAITINDKAIVSKAVFTVEVTKDNPNT